MVSSRAVGQRGPVLGLTHAALEALTDTCYANLAARQGTSRIQRTAFTDYLDRRHLRAYEEFLKESAQAFLSMHETWLKRHEVKSLRSSAEIIDPRRRRRLRHSRRLTDAGSSPPGRRLRSSRIDVKSDRLLPLSRPRRCTQTLYKEPLL